MWSDQKLPFFSNAFPKQGFQQESVIKSGSGLESKQREFSPDNKIIDREKCTFCGDATVYFRVHSKHDYYRSSSNNKWRSSKKELLGKYLTRKSLFSCFQLPLLSQPLLCDYTWGQVLQLSFSRNSLFGVARNIKFCGRKKRYSIWIV